MDIFESDKPNKRFVAIYKDKKYYFGSPTGFTFIDGASVQTRDNYLKRHMANATEKHKIDNFIMSPALLSAYVLWNTPDIHKNIKILERLLKI
jgi:hypothetical protein